MNQKNSLINKKRNNKINNINKDDNLNFLNDIPIYTSDKKYKVQFLNDNKALVHWNLCEGLMKKSFWDVIIQDKHHTLDKFLKFDKRVQYLRLHASFNSKLKKGFITIAKKSKGGKKYYYYHSLNGKTINEIHNIICEIKILKQKEIRNKQIIEAKIKSINKLIRTKDGKIKKITEKINVGYSNASEQIWDEAPGAWKLFAFHPISPFIKSKKIKYTTTKTRYIIDEEAKNEVIELKESKEREYNKLSNIEESISSLEYNYDLVYGKLKELEQQRLEQQRLEEERLEQEKLEQERLEQQRLEQERLEQERLEQERLEYKRNLLSVCILTTLAYIYQKNYEKSNNESQNSSESDEDSVSESENSSESDDKDDFDDLNYDFNLSESDDDILNKFESNDEETSLLDIEDIQKFKPISFSDDENDLNHFSNSGHNFLKDIPYYKNDINISNDNRFNYFSNYIANCYKNSNIINISNNNFTSNPTDDPTYNHLEYHNESYSSFNSNNNSSIHINNFIPNPTNEPTYDHLEYHDDSYSSYSSDSDSSSDSSIHIKGPFKYLNEKK